MTTQSVPALMKWSLSDMQGAEVWDALSPHDFGRTNWWRTADQQSLELVMLGFLTRH